MHGCFGDLAVNASERVLAINHKHPLPRLTPESVGGRGSGADGVVERRRSHGDGDATAETKRPRRTRIPRSLVRESLGLARLEHDLESAEHVVENGTKVL